MSASYWQGSEPKNCDVCKCELTESFVDGRTVNGPWALLCPTCHREIGVDLGTGKGQKYVKHSSGVWYKEN